MCMVYMTQKTLLNSTKVFNSRNERGREGRGRKRERKQESIFLHKNIRMGKYF